ncbi:MAG: PfkB family carbohydrate kinase [Oscillospiraceae bacterium]|jgi:2-dehydro-3-deoxygluconokinase|nr:PfkB family carbohydrate kinase [Oscillospiraceae bacterium]
MIFDFRKDCAWAVVVPTSMGVRITPANGQPVHCSNTFTMQATSAESNVATVAASLGMPAKVLTCFVKGSPIARFIKSDLRSRNLDFEGPELAQDGPWGFRHQFNIADSGFGSRGPIVHNDRAGEVGLELNIKDFDTERLFGKEGVRILHMSGLIAALSPGSAELCLELAKAAKKHGTLVSFDMNYRASFWKGRETELRSVFSQIASMCDILVGNEEDFQLSLGIEGPEHGGKDLGAKIESFKQMIQRVRAAYPSARVYGTTLRQVVSVGVHMWGSIMLAGDTWDVIQPREINVLDRIGGGDGFVGGMLYGILKGYDAEKCNSLGWASGALAATMLTDYGLPVDEEQLLSIAAGNARVKR